MIFLVQYTLLVTAFIYILFELNKNFCDSFIAMSYRGFVFLGCVIISYYSNMLNKYYYTFQFIVLLFGVWHMMYSIMLLFGVNNETCTNTRTEVD